MSKYRNVKTTLDGITFDSAKEARRYAELCLLKKAGLINSLYRQAEIELIPAQKDERGKVIERPVKYKADFKYWDCESGSWVYEDVKGVKTKEYVIKRKLALWRYGIRIKEV